jgi:hypothetical protein
MLPKVTKTTSSPQSMRRPRLSPIRFFLLVMAITGVYTLTMGPRLRTTTTRLTGMTTAQDHTTTALGLPVHLRAVLEERERSSGRRDNAHHRPPMDTRQANVTGGPTRLAFKFTSLG